MPDAARDDLFEVGRVVRPFGNRGEVAVVSTADTPERFLDVERVFLRFTPGAAPLPYPIDGVRIHKGRAMIGFVGIETISDAETLRGAVVLLPREELLPLGDEEYLLYDLCQCEVFAADGAALGTISGYEDTGAQILLRIRLADASEHLVPFVNTFFPEVDLAARRVVLTPIPGLLGDAV